ncbi:MAG: thiol:disulfide interchange protein DsbA/DsbL [Burkholderiales bacterium]|jgi:thiol:disulfide interchange protein DsbA|nr:thiol:disulfide interchange protein DsbA/DsbL [Burkholderiales bacterium]
MKIVHPLFSRGLRLTALLTVFAWVALSLSSNAFAASSKNEKVSRIAPQATEVPDGKVEVIEFFSYLCNHCASLNPHVDTWKKTLPDDVVFRKIPVSWGGAQWNAMARTFYALDAIGEESRLSPDIFDALHKERINLTDKKTFLDWAEKKGVDRKKLEEMYDSFAVNSKVMQSEKKAKSYEVSSVPRFYIDGRYEINTEAVGSTSLLLSTIDEVIETVRKEAKKK